MSATGSGRPRLAAWVYGVVIARGGLDRHLQPWPDERAPAGSDVRGVIDVQLRGWTLRGLAPMNDPCATSRPSARDVDLKRPSQASTAATGTGGMSRARSGGRLTDGTNRRSFGPVLKRRARLGLMHRQKCWLLVLAFRMQLPAARANVHSSVGRPISRLSQGVLRMPARSVRTAVGCAEPTARPRCPLKLLVPCSPAGFSASRRARTIRTHQCRR